MVFFARVARDLTLRIWKANCAASLKPHHWRTGPGELPQCQLDPIWNRAGIHHAQKGLPLLLGIEP
jgi:hypothetical protein